MHNHKYLNKYISQNRSFWDKFFETQSLIFLTQVDVRSKRKGVLTINNNEAITRISKIFAKNRKFTIYKSPSHNVSVGTSVYSKSFFSFWIFSVLPLCFQTQRCVESSSRVLCLPGLAAHSVYCLRRILQSLSLSQWNSIIILINPMPEVN